MFDSAPVFVFGALPVVPVRAEPRAAPRLSRRPVPEIIAGTGAAAPPTGEAFGPVEGMAAGADTMGAAGPDRIGERIPVGPPSVFPRTFEPVVDVVPEGELPNS